MDFPDKTLELADRLAHGYRKDHKGNKRAISRRLFSDNIRDYGYGYFDAAADGLWVRYPHEVKRSMECFEVGVFIYAVAEACGLEPRIHAADGLADLDGNSGHLLVDVEVGNKSRVIIDPVQRVYGSASYSGDKVVVRNNPTTKRTRYGFNTLEEVDKDTLIETIEFLRSTEGSIAMLSAGQQLHNSRLHNEFIHYNKEKRELEFQVRYHPSFIHNKLISKVFSLDECGNVTGIRLDMSIFKTTSWEEFVGRELLLSIPYDGEPIADSMKLILSKCKGKSVEVDDSIAINFLREVAYDLTKNAKGEYLFSPGMREYVVLFPYKSKMRKIKRKKRLRAEDKDVLYQLEGILGPFGERPYDEFFETLLDRVCFIRTMKKHGEDEFEKLEDLIESAVGLEQRSDIGGITLFKYFADMLDIFRVIRERNTPKEYNRLEKSTLAQVKRYLTQDLNPA